MPTSRDREVAREILDAIATAIEQARAEEREELETWVLEACVGYGKDDSSFDDGALHALGRVVTILRARSKEAK